MNGASALAALAILRVLLNNAHAAEVRGAMTVSANVSVTGSVDVKTTRSESARAATPEKIGTCASVALVCKGPTSMRVTIHTDENATMAGDDFDLCAASASDSQHSSLSVCTSQAANASTLGVTVDY